MDEGVGSEKIREGQRDENKLTDFSSECGEKASRYGRKKSTR